MENWLFIFIIILLCSAWLWLHKNSKAALSHNKSVSSTKPHAKTYHGTSIHPCSQACEHVSHLKGKRFLASEVTSLPVYGCTNPRCTCTYIHLDDRRCGDDRRYASLTMEDVFSENEHRFSRTDRRKHSFV